ncbi:MAG: hypothetical protein ACQES9_05550 [Myxococcota bacterium]
MFLKKGKIRQFINKQKNHFQHKVESLFDMPASLFPGLNRNKISKIMQMKVFWLEKFLLQEQNLDFDKLVGNLFETLELDALVLFKISSTQCKIISSFPENYNLNLFLKLKTIWLKEKDPENFILKNIDLKSINFKSSNFKEVNSSPNGNSIKVSIIPIKSANTIKGGFFLVHSSRHPVQFGNFDLSQVRDFALYLSRVF